MKTIEIVDENDELQETIVSPAATSQEPTKKDPPASVIEPSEEPVNITISPGSLDEEDTGPADKVDAVNDKIEEADENEEDDIQTNQPHELQSSKTPEITVAQ